MNKYLVVGDNAMFGKQTFKNFPKIGNIGNSMFPLGMMSLVYNGENIVDLIEIGAKDYERVEEVADFMNKYDVLLMPFPDKMRPKNAEYFSFWNKLLPKLTCKFCLASIARFPDTLKTKINEEDIEEYKKFFTFIFDKCKSINVRGENSKNFIVSLGFPEERIKALGCPSMYGIGPGLKLKDSEINSDSKLVVCENVLEPEYNQITGVTEFFENNIKRFKKWEYIATRQVEAALLKNAKKFNEIIIEDPTHPYARVIEKCLKTTDTPLKGLENFVYP